jgi:hypothetical protein
MLSDHDNYYLDKEEPHKSCLLALKEIILASDTNVATDWKYSMPFFCYKGKMFCYLWTDKVTHEPYIGFVEGNRMNHRELEQGKRSRMKIMRIDPNKDLPVKAIQSILNEALDFYRNGIIKVK